MKQLGNLIEMRLSEFWQSEPYAFNPFIAENLHLIGDIIGESLTLVEREHKAAADSRRSLDILARTQSGDLVAIELQYNGADESHSWRLLAYASAARAKICVLVCESIDSFHKLAWERLNEDARDTKYYVLLARLFRVDDSKPVFELLPHIIPADEEVQAFVEDVAENQNERKRYWMEFKEFYLQHNQSRITREQVLGVSNKDHINLISLKKDRYFSAVARNNYIGIRIEIGQDTNPELSQKLKELDLNTLKELIPDAELKVSSEGVNLTLLWKKAFNPFDDAINSYKWFVASSDKVYDAVIKPMIIEGGL